MPVPITLLYGGLLGLLVTMLGMRVSAGRGKVNPFTGEPPPVEFIRPIRAHGNATEWIPMAVILLLTLELSGAGHVALHVFGGGFLAGRILHAYGILGKSKASTLGATITYFALLGMSGWAVGLHFAK